MGLSQKLCNGTPYEAVIPYNNNSKIRIPADSQITIPPHMVDDFRKDTPGYEDVRKLLAGFGCFLYDTDKSYDLQVLEALDAFIKERGEQYDAAVSRLRQNLMSVNQTVTAEALAPHLERMELYKETVHPGEPLPIKNKVDEMKARREKLKSALTASGQIGSRAAPKFDPLKTSFGCAPPREFPSEILRDLFHDENPEIKAKHNSMVSQMTKAEPAKQSTVSE
jgi:hypothetical protein